MGEILLIDLAAFSAEILRREGDQITELVRGRDATLHLASVDLWIAMAELYEGLDIDAEAAA